jgi:anti-sigma factor RsiW
MMGLATMWTCHWSARRIQRYLDADPSAPLSAEEIRRLEAHLATCERCSAAAAEYRGLRRALASWASRHGPDPVLVDRMQQAAEQLIAQDAR